MNLKEQQQKICETSQHIWRYRQYLAILSEQQQALFEATPETARRTAQRIEETRGCLKQEARRLEALTAGLMAAIEGVGDGRIQEILTRRYLKKQTFAEIAAAMDYDQRWVYRLHHQGLVLTEGAADEAVTPFKASGAP
jgi:DNA-directed RNA polymerase specialized sigma subunit